MAELLGVAPCWLAMLECCNLTWQSHTMIGEVCGIWGSSVLLGGVAGCLAALQINFAEPYVDGGGMWCLAELIAVWWSFLLHVQATYLLFGGATVLFGGAPLAEHTGCCLVELQCCLVGPDKITIFLKKFFFI